MGWERIDCWEIRWVAVMTRRWLVMVGMGGCDGDEVVGYGGGAAIAGC